MTATHSKRAPGWTFDPDAARAADRLAPERYLLPIASDSIVLEIGPTIGTTLGIAPFCRLAIGVSTGFGQLRATTESAEAALAGDLARVAADPRRLPFAPAVFDCILLREAAGPELLASLLDLLKPAGALCIRCRRLPRLSLRAAGFTHIRRYGILPSQSDGAEHLSLDGVTGVSFYFRNVDSPSGLLEKLKTALKRALASLGFAPLLFGEFLIVAERGAGLRWDQ
jgi:SAM-dependent methyltransferase